MTHSTTNSSELRRQLVDRLRQLREKTGLTQTQAGHATSSSRFQVGRIENGQLPSYDQLLAFLRAYYVQADEQAQYIAWWEHAWEAGKHRVPRNPTGGPHPAEVT